MGTNYYLTSPPCPRCGRSAERIHIGKSSAGWVFALHVYPEGSCEDITIINDLSDWQKLWAQPGVEIRDEYGRLHTPEEMTATITEREWPRKESYTATFYRNNHAQPGPNGLLRSVVDGRRCIGQGAGTWDLHVGYFS